MPRPHESRFRYSLERPYPYRWFTPLSFALGLGAAVLFTFINIAADGYVQQVVYTTDPNATLSNDHWYSHPPWSWISTAASSCQSAGISIGSAHYTSNQQTASYTVSNMNTTIGADEEHAMYPGLSSKVLGITTYLNNTLRGCAMPRIVVSFTSQEQASSAVLQFQTGPIYCTIAAGSIVNMTIGQTFSGSQFIFDQRTSLSQYMVYDFLRQTFDALMEVIHALNNTNDYTGTTIDLAASQTAAITDDDFFLASITGPGKEENLVSSPDNSTDEQDDASAFPLAKGQPQNLARLLDAVAKSYYSVIMWDLNFDRASNAFTNNDTVQYLATAVNDARVDDNATALVPDPVLGSDSLAGSPAQFEIQYICSVPRKKDAGSLVISVVVANIVLLSVFWNLLNWLTMSFLRTREPDWNVCAGCLQQRGRGIQPLPGNARIRDLDQDPLCQNVIVEEQHEAESRQSRDPEWQFWRKSSAGGRPRARSFKSTSSKGSFGGFGGRRSSTSKGDVSEYIQLSE